MYRAAELGGGEIKFTQDERDTGKGYDDEAATSYLGGKSWNGLARKHQ